MRIMGSNTHISMVGYISTTTPLILVDLRPCNFLFLLFKYFFFFVDKTLKKKKKVKKKIGKNQPLEACCCELNKLKTDHKKSI